MGDPSLLNMTRYCSTGFKTTFCLFPNNVRNDLRGISFFAGLFASQENLSHLVFAAIECKTSFEMVNVCLKLAKCNAFLWSINGNRTNTQPRQNSNITASTTLNVSVNVYFNLLADLCFNNEYTSSTGRSTLFD